MTRLNQGRKLHECREKQLISRFLPTDTEPLPSFESLKHPETQMENIDMTQLSHKSSKHENPMSIIDEFLDYYNREYDHYLGVARTCDTLCEIFLSQSGVRGIVSSRAKKLDRLREKLIARNQEQNYSTFNDIYRDIVDLAGTRIALYFPGDEGRVRKFLESSFDVFTIKEFPQASKMKLQLQYKKRFSGYSAVHYVVKMKRERLPEEKHRYCDTLIEIQIASVLMHAWAEVEHDLIYKPSTGEISDDEYAILDELNGLVLSGEIALERLQNAMKERVAYEAESFHNHYELAAYLYKVLKTRSPEMAEEPIMGRIDLLLGFLQSIELDTPQKLRGFISGLELSTDGQPVAGQIIDRILSENPDFYCIYADTQKDVKTLSPYRTCEIGHNFPMKEGSIEYFISRWIRFESVFRDTFRKIIPMENNEEFIYPTLENLDKLDMFDHGDIFELESIKKLRNDLVHGINQPSSETLHQAGNILERITSAMKAKVKSSAYIKPA